MRPCRVPGSLPFSIGLHGEQPSAMAQDCGGSGSGSRITRILNSWKQGGSINADNPRKFKAFTELCLRSDEVEAALIHGQYRLIQ